MTTNRILDYYGASSAFTITLASLATSAVGVGQQSTIVDNSATKEMWAKIFVKITQGAGLTGNKGAYVYLILVDDGNPVHRSDNAGAADAGITILNASPIMTLKNKAVPGDGDILYGEALVRLAVPKFGIAIVHDTGANLDATAGNHWARYILLGPDIQAAA